MSLACILLTSFVLLAPPEQEIPSTPVVHPRAISVLTLQPDAMNGTDAHILNLTPLSNYGDNASLLVGPDAVNGSLARSLLWFNLSGLPPVATILNASLELYQEFGGAGTVEVRRVMAPWTEGTGELSRTEVPVTVTETAGVPRTRESVGIFVSFSPGSIGDPARDLRVYDGAVEVPSQVYGYTYSGPEVSGAWVYFGATVGVNGTKTFNVTYSSAGMVVPTYRTKNWSASPLWTFGPTGGGASSASIVDLDDDGALEVVFGGAAGCVYALNETGQLEWGTQVSALRSVPYAPQVVDMDGDGALDIVVFANTPEVARRDRTGSDVWRASYGVANLPLSTPTLLDVDDDGVLDVLIGGKTRAVDALSGVDGTPIQSYPAGDWAYTPTVADVDGDGRGEIIFASDDGLVHAYDKNGTQLWASAPVGIKFPETSVAVGDIDQDGVLEAIASDDENGGPIFALRATNGSVAWSTPVTGWPEGGHTLADLDGDGTLETIVGLDTSPTGTLHALRGSDGGILWTYSDTGILPLYPAIVDVNNDRERDIIYVTKLGMIAVRVVNRTGALLHQWNVTSNNPGFRSLSQYHMSSPAVVDLDGDGTLEILVPTGNGLEAFVLGLQRGDDRGRRALAGLEDLGLPLEPHAPRLRRKLTEWSTLPQCISRSPPDRPSGRRVVDLPRRGYGLGYTRWRLPRTRVDYGERTGVDLMECYGDGPRLAHGGVPERRPHVARNGRSRGRPSWVP